ncbi:hypothetical protein PVAND_015055 [Polypedilum vanderplanki]|uniref:Uncharacterized protein n=1 Tax=Polypedilum vanderplanki TaxID=319348 RepID=A0A9J6BBJ8_POLVA|nr:hypothetical protein PVAND_015055 [Polypedilum vanderplanki]
MLFKSHYTTHNRFENITIIVSDQIFMNSLSSHYKSPGQSTTKVTIFLTLKEISRNRLMGRPRAFGTINFCKLNIEPRITDRIKIEKGNSNNHVEISGFKLENRLTIIHHQSRFTEGNAIGSKRLYR